MTKEIVVKTAFVGTSAGRGKMAQRQDLSEISWEVGCRKSVAGSRLGMPMERNVGDSIGYAK